MGSVILKRSTFATSAIRTSYLYGTSTSSHLKAARCGHKVVTANNNEGGDSKYAHNDTVELDF